MSVSLNLIHVLIVGITFLALSIILNRKFDLYNTWITVIKKFGPIWLVFFPPFITYLIICGTFSMLTVEIYKFVIGGLENFDPSLFMKLEKGVEYTCSFFVPLVYFRILQKEKFPSFWGWAIIITITHSLTAGYRDPKLDFDPLNPTYMETGPQLLENIHYLDAIIPLLSFMFFYFVLRKSLKLES